MSSKKNESASDKYIGLDYGEKTIGVAISHNGRVATALTTLKRKEPAALRPCLKELKTILRENNIKNIVLGFPKNLSGEYSARCAETLAFKEKLLRYFKNINVILWDERLSTLAVSRVFNGKRKNYKKNVDAMAATYILQGYLDYKNGKEKIMDEHELEMHEDELFLEDEDGNKIAVNIVATKQDENGVYMLAVTTDESEAILFKCSPSNEDTDELVMEIIDNEDELFESVFELFREEFEEYGIETEGES